MLTGAEKSSGLILKKEHSTIPKSMTFPLFYYTLTTYFLKTRFKILMFPAKENLKTYVLPYFL